MDVTAPTTEQNLLWIFGRGRYVRQETLTYLKIDRIYQVKLLLNLSRSEEIHL
jgi:hypothetical protein